MHVVLSCYICDKVVSQEHMTNTEAGSPCPGAREAGLCRNYQCPGAARILECSIPPDAGGLCLWGHQEAEDRV